MGTADELLDQMFSWIEKMESCAENMRKLAMVLRPPIMIKTRKKQQEHQKRLKELRTEAYNEENESEKILENINKLEEKERKEVKENEMKEVKVVKEMKEMKEMEEDEKNEVDRRVMCEVLKAIVKRSGLEMNPELTLDKFMDEYLKGFFYDGLTDSFIKRLLTSLRVILAFFGFIFSGTTSARLFAEGGGSMAVGRAAGLVSSLRHAIKIGTDLIKRNNVTEASQSLRDTADGIRKMTKTLREQFDDIEMTFEEMAKSEDSDDDDDSDYELEERTDSVFELRESEDENENSETIKVGLLNVQSLNKKTNENKEIIGKKKLKVFLTTETWLQPDNAEEVLRKASPSDLPSPIHSPPNFKFFHQERGMLGVAIISRALNPSQKEEKKKPKTFGYVAVHLKHAEWNQPVLFINVYHKPDLEKLDIFLEEFKRFLDKVHENYKSVIVISDILVDIKRLQNSFKSIIDRKRFIQRVEEPTHQSENIQHRVITKNVEISELQEDEVTSDHYFFKFKARPKDANKEHEVQTMVVLNIGSVDIDPSTIPKLMKDKTLDVFFTTQSKKEDLEKHLNLQPYLTCHSVWKKKGGGVAIQYKEYLKGEERRRNRNPKTFEYVAAELDHAEWIKPVLFINVYRPPGLTKVEIEAFRREFQGLLDELSKGYNSIIITGDFNIHVDVKRETVRKPKYATKMFEKFLKDNDLTQHVEEPTHKAGNTLDLVITRNVEISQLTVRTDIEISDHYPVTFKATPKLFF